MMFAVRDSDVDLYVDCELISTKPLAPRSRIAINGNVVLGRTLPPIPETVRVSKQYLLSSCAQLAPSRFRKARPQYSMTHLKHGQLAAAEKNTRKNEDEIEREVESAASAVFFSLTSLNTELRVLIGEKTQVQFLLTLNWRRTGGTSTVVSTGPASCCEVMSG